MSDDKCKIINGPDVGVEFDLRWGVDRYEIPNAVPGNYNHYVRMGDGQDFCYAYSWRREGANFVRWVSEYVGHVE